MGRLELDLGQLELNHHRTLQKVVYTPVSDTVAREFPVRGRQSALVLLRPLSVAPNSLANPPRLCQPLLNTRKKLTQLNAECESAAARWVAAAANAGCVQAIRFCFISSKVTTTYRPLLPTPLLLHRMQPDICRGASAKDGRRQGGGLSR